METVSRFFPLNDNEKSVKEVGGDSYIIRMKVWMYQI